MRAFCLENFKTRQKDKNCTYRSQNGGKPAFGLPGKPAVMLLSKGCYGRLKKKGRLKANGFGNRRQTTLCRNLGQ